MANTLHNWHTWADVANKIIKKNSINILKILVKIRIKNFNFSILEER